MNNPDRIKNLAEVSQPIRANLDKLALASRILEMEGHGSRTLGHTALRDPEGRGIWIKRWGLTLGEVFDWTDFQLIDFDGRLLYGDGAKRHNEWPIHARIMRRRADINVTAHTHPRHGAVFSAVDEPLVSITSLAPFRSPPPRFTRTSETVTTKEAGDELAEVLDDHPAIFLRNHGVVFCGNTVESMTVMGIHLEEICRDVLMVKASGFAYSVPSPAEHERRHRSFEASLKTRTIDLYFAHFAEKLRTVQALGHPDLPTKRRDHAAV